MQEDRVQDGAVDVVLALVEGSVADPYRLGAVVAGQVVDRLSVNGALAVDAVHDLKRPSSLRSGRRRTA
jgi:hypothetical protein